MAWKSSDGKREASGLVSQLETLINGMLNKKTLLDSGFGVKVITPPSGKDWNDCLVAGTLKKAIDKRIEQATLEQLPEDETGFKAEKQGIKHIFTIGPMTYRLTGVKEIFVSHLRVQIKAEYGDEPHWDGLDLYSSKSRTYYSNKLADVYDIEAKIVEKRILYPKHYQKSIHLAVSLENDSAKREDRIGH